MKTSQKALLTLAVTGLIVGIIVALRHAEPAPAWTLALPVGVVCLGLFLLSLVWQKEMAKFEEEERLKFDSVRRRQLPISNSAKKRGPPSANDPGLAAAHSG
jgi:hypothetical protein